MKIIEYLSSGKIIGVISAPDGYESLYTDPEPLKLFVYDDTLDVGSQTHYLDESLNVQERIAQPTTLTGLELTSVPVPSTLTVSGRFQAEATVTDSTVTLDIAVPGTYSVAITADDPKYLPWQQKVVVP